MEAKKRLQLNVSETLDLLAQSKRVRRTTNGDCQQILYSRTNNIVLTSCRREGDEGSLYRVLPRHVGHAMLSPTIPGQSE